MRHDVAAIPDAIEQPAGRSRLLSRLYHEIGLAAVAFELDVEIQDLDAGGMRSDPPRRALSQFRAAGPRFVSEGVAGAKNLCHCERGEATQLCRGCHLVLFDGTYATRNYDVRFAPLPSAGLLRLRSQ